MIFSHFQPPTQQKASAAALRRKFLRETESFLAKELRLRDTQWPTKTRRLRSRLFAGR
ncbi:MAG TPA: hypothetical protein VGG64_23330 [Pirellulales bacterium]|jgi:hypothetical protein